MLILIPIFIIILFILYIFIYKKEESVDVPQITFETIQGNIY